MLHYPLAPLRSSIPSRPPNILVIGLDAMRPDAVDPRIAPNIAAFAQRAIRFENHWSGGNGTRVGLFSLFYAIPPTYWKEFYSEQRSPVLIDELQSAGYRLGIFPGNPPDKIVGLDRTAFRNVAAGDLVATRGDEQVASGWIRWLENRDPGKPFFGFLFFESAPGGCKASYPQVGEVKPGATEMEKRRVCYDTAIHHADEQAGAVLKDLEQRGLLDETIVIITSDHGQEFDENGLGFHGHGSSYSGYQLHTPFILRWPGRSPGVVGRGPPTTTSRRPCWPTCSAAPIPPATTVAAGTCSRDPNGSGWSPRATPDSRWSSRGRSRSARGSTSRSATPRAMRWSPTRSSTATCCCARSARPAASTAINKTLIFGGRQ